MSQHQFIEFQNESCIPIPAEQTVLRAALDAAIPIFHICGGNAKCSTCRVLVTEGKEHLSPPTEKENALNKKLSFPKNVRLAYQTTVNGGPVKLQRIIQDEGDINLYVSTDKGMSVEQIGEEKEAVLFFLDIRNFTQYVETHLPFDIIHIIRKIFSLVQTIVASNNGQIIETSGDGLYIVFGCEEGRVASVNNAVQAALSILTQLQELNGTYLTRYFSTPLRVGIGIHIGRVVSGAIRLGDSERMIIMGLPVNIASRLQNATKELNNSLVVSSTVYNLLIGKTNSKPSLKLNVKGVSKELEVFLLGEPFV